MENKCYQAFVYSNEVSAVSVQKSHDLHAHRKSTDSTKLPILKFVPMIISNAGAFYRDNPTERKDASQHFETNRD